ncbi:hypothetical protein EV361DRAFT_933649 [Lentinula raphanica]|nr:hypothetical protein EV361DRAFT_933649 [Lentinula raphanica]
MQELERYQMTGSPCRGKRQDGDVWECAHPSLSTLLEDPRINDPDSFVMCVQIHCPVGPSLAAQPAVYYVPKDLLDGLEASHDIPYVNVNRNVSSTIHVHRQLSPIHSGNTRGRYGYS